MEWLIVAGLVVVVALLVARRKVAHRRTDALRRRFGQEYNRLLAETGDRRATEDQLRSRQQRRAALDLHGLSAAARTDYKRRWRENQAAFVDDPGKSVDQAAALLDELARERGYPVDDPAEHVELLSVDHPRLVERYRVAVAVHQRMADASPSTDDLRTAFRNYRTLFDDLLVSGGGAFVRHEQDVH